MEGIVGLRALVTSCNCCELGPCPVSNAHVRRICSPYCPTSCHCMNEKRHWRWSLLLGLVGYSVTYFYSKIRDCPCIGQQTWTALVDSLPVAKADVQKLPTMLELREIGGRPHSICRRRCCLGRVDVTCDKFDNRWYVLKTGNR